MIKNNHESRKSKFINFMMNEKTRTHTKEKNLDIVTNVILLYFLKNILMKLFPKFYIIIQSSCCLVVYYFILLFHDEVQTIVLPLLQVVFGVVCLL